MVSTTSVTGPFAAAPAGATGAHGGPPHPRAGPIVTDEIPAGRCRGGRSILSWRGRHGRLDGVVLVLFRLERDQHFVALARRCLLAGRLFVEVDRRRVDGRIGAVLEQSANG